jgi:hypothetical protein
MPTWFVYRSPYHGPLSKHVRRLDGADTLLDYHGRFNVLDDWDEPNEHGPRVRAGEEQP